MTVQSYRDGGPGWFCHRWGEEVSFSTATEGSTAAGLPQQHRESLENEGTAMEKNQLTNADAGRALDLPDSTLCGYGDRFLEFLPMVGEGRKRRYREGHEETPSWRFPF